MYVGNQVRITLDSNTHYYVDLVFYNKILRSYVLIDLKREDMKPDYVGQMNMYINYYNKEVRNEYDNETIGIILCTGKKEVTMEYALGGLTNNVFASTYTYYLPDKEELINEVEKVYNKLVRDKIPKIIEERNGIPYTRILNDEEYRIELERKLLEECQEVIEAPKETRKEELADVLEVLNALAELENSTLEKIIKIAKEKEEKRGAFKEKIYLEKVIEGE